MASDPRIKWRSTKYPQMVLTTEHYNELRPRLPLIQSFKEELLNAELWLDDNPKKVPKKNWRRFITNWMRSANRFTQERNERTLARGYKPTISQKQSGLALAEIMRRSAQSDTLFPPRDIASLAQSTLSPDKPPLPRPTPEQRGVIEACSNAEIPNLLSRISRSAFLLHEAERTAFDLIRVKRIEALTMIERKKLVLLDYLINEREANVP